MASHPEDPWERLSVVLAKAAGVDSPAAFEEQAKALAKTLRGVRYDWAGEPRIRWSMASDLLQSLRAEQARRQAETEQRLVEADHRWRATIPAGVPVDPALADLSAATLMLAGDSNRRGGRRSVLEDALAHVGTVFHPIRDGQAGQ
jgi:hypothetical protein